MVLALVVGFYVLTWAIPDLAKWAIILIGSFVIIMVVYEFLIRRINVLRVLFGMKPHARSLAAPSKETALAR
jgi:glucan biosynthesis protein C